MKKHKTDFSQFKHFFSWKRSLRKGASSLIDKQPWLTFDAIEIIKKYLASDSKVFEYGGGGSTLFFAPRVNEVVTAEHDEKWFHFIESELREKIGEKWKGFLIPPRPGNLAENPDPADPDQYSSSDENYSGQNFKDYVTLIDKFQDEYFDLVLVDGRSRPACIKHAIPKLKKGGLLVIDNADRKYYFDFLEKEIDEKFRVIHHQPGACPYNFEFTLTSIREKK